MNRTTWLQDRRMQKFRDVLSRWERRELSMMEAGGAAGDVGAAVPALSGPLRGGRAWQGLLDRRLGQAVGRSAFRRRDAQRMLELYRTGLSGLEREAFPRASGCATTSSRWGYTWTKTQLHAAGLVERAKRRGAHRRKRERKPCEGMMLHQDGSRHGLA